MSSKIVRSSKFRHVFGAVAKKEECYDDLKVTRNAWDSNYIAANPAFFAVIAESAGGGSFYVVPWSVKGKIDPKMPLITGHKSAVLDLDWNPFNDNLVASASEDGYVKVWGIPEGGLKDNMTEPLQTLVGHKRKVGTVNFNPVANNIVATSSGDFSVKVWDINKGSCPYSLEAQHTDLIQSCQWNSNGSLLSTTSKDKKIRIVDPRQNSVAAESEGHQGVKGSRCIWLNGTRLFSTGFSKNSEREFYVWDQREFSKPLSRQNVDSASGLLMPFYDPDTSMVYLAGKGDGNIRYYEVVDEAPYFYYLSEFKSATALRGGCMIPKRGVNVSECEVARFLKVAVKTMEPISFQVPRKSDMFQDDIFPDCVSGDYALTAEEWMGGSNAEPKKMSLKPGFVQKEKKANDFNPEKREEEKQLSEKELRDEYEKLKKRVAYLESELVKRDAKIKELGGN